MKLKLLSFLLLFSIVLSAQTGTIKVQKPVKETATKKDTANNGPSYFDVYYGYKTFFHSFGKQLNTVYKFKISQPAQLISVGGSGHYLLNRSSDFYGHMLYSYVIPQPVRINDSIHCKMTGFIFSFAYGGAFESDNQHFLTILYVGFNTGRLRFYGDEQVRQKNPFFSPKVGIQPKLLIGKFTVTLIAEAEYDVSKPNWRRLNVANKDKTDIAKFRQSGITTLIGVSYKLINFADNKDSNGWDNDGAQ
ncbi:MAG: hypothetical protein JWP12_3929 [Bacteroidetes bacterium]|nr:hypothetical protein [Bacteroidota bacterium]